MKYWSLLLIAGCVSCASLPKDHFVLRGTIPGAPDSAIVELFPEPGILKQFYIVDEKFEITGKLERPTLASLRVRDRQGYRMIDFFAENGMMTFETPHWDSLPLMGKDADIRMERNYTLRGSRSQNDWWEYQQSTIDLRQELADAQVRCGNKASSAAYRELAVKKAELEQVAREFIAKHHNLEVNLQVAEVFERTPFTYDAAYVDGVLELFASYRDTCSGLREFRADMEKMRMSVQGLPLRDAKVVTPARKEVRLLDQLNKGGYTFIDLWASWCGSCRMENPNVKVLYNKYKDKVKFVSVAVSDRDEAWRQAMKEESMSWEQFKDSGEVLAAMRNSYNTTSIPSFFLIDPNGCIVYKGSRSGDLEVQLENIFNR